MISRERELGFFGSLLLLSLSLSRSFARASPSLTRDRFFLVAGGVLFPALVARRASAILAIHLAGQRDGHRLTAGLGCAEISCLFCFCPHKKRQERGFGGMNCRFLFLN